jgi:hypothetical protein
LGTNPNHREHPAGEAVFRAVRKITVGAAAGTVAYHRDRLGLQPGVEQLTPVGFHQIEMQTGANVAVTGGARGQKQQRVFFLYRIRIIYIAKELRGIRKLCFKLVADLVSHRVTALADARTNRRYQILGSAAELKPHPSYSILDNPFQSAAPPRVESGHGPLFAVGNENRDTVCGLNGEEDARLVGHHAITLRTAAP